MLTTRVTTFSVSADRFWPARQSSSCGTSILEKLSRPLSQICASDHSSYLFYIFGNYLSCKDGLYIVKWLNHSVCRNCRDHRLIIQVVTLEFNSPRQLYLYKPCRRGQKIVLFCTVILSRMSQWNEVCTRYRLLRERSEPELLSVLPLS